MPFSKIWTKLFSKQSQADEIDLHVAGATTRHWNPFETLEVWRNEEELDEAFDQGEVLCALEHLDKAAADARRTKCNNFVADKSYCAWIDIGIYLPKA